MVGAANPNNGMLSFDNIGAASLAIFASISGGGWSDLMHQLQDDEFRVMAIEDDDDDDDDAAAADNMDPGADTDEEDAL